MNNAKLTQNNSKVYLVAAGAISAISLLAFLLWKKKQQGNPAEQNTNQADPKGKKSDSKFLKDHKYHDLIKECKEELESNENKTKLSKKLLGGINKATIALIENDYIARIYYNRKLRRNFMSDLNSYSNELIKGLNGKETLINDGTAEVLKDLGINPEFHRHQLKNAYHEDSTFAYMSIYLLENIKSRMPEVHANVTKANLMEYYRTQVESYDKFNFQNLGYPTDKLLMAKQYYMSDVASLKTGIEDEDIAKSKDLLKEKDIQDLAKKLEEKVYEETQRSNKFAY